MFILAFCVSLQAETSVEKRPTGLTWQQTKHHVKLKPGQQNISVDFEYENTSDQTIEVTEIRSSCGCTVAKLDDRTLEPGESGKLTVDFNATGRRGHQLKRIIVRTTDPNRPVTTLVLDATIPEVLRVRPAFVHWTADKPTQTRQVRIEVVAPYELESLTFNDPPQALQINTKTLEGKPIHLVELTPTGKPANSPMIRLQAKVKLKTGETVSQWIHVRLPKQSTQTASAETQP